MRRFLEDPRTIWASRVVVAGVFLVYGATKMVHPEAFARSIHNYRLVPLHMENALAMTLPWIEVLTAVALLTRMLRAGGIVAIAGMLTVFVAAIVSALARGLDINCGCFTLSADTPAYNNLWQELVFNIILMGMVLHLWWAHRREAEAQ